MYTANAVGQSNICSKKLPDRPKKIISPRSTISTGGDHCSAIEMTRNEKSRRKSTNTEKESVDDGTDVKKHRRRTQSKERSILQRFFYLLRSVYGTQEEQDETDDFSIHLTRYRPEELAKLTKTTKFSKREIQLMYRGFKQECPTGLVDEDSFKSIFGQFFPQGDASQYAHYVFNTIKHNSEGQITFEDFLKALSTVSRGSTQEKLEWIFGLYDTNHDGMITKNEMMDVAHAIYDMVGTAARPPAEAASAKDHVEKIFQLIDTNKDGAITIEELAEWVSSDDTIIQSLSMMDTVLYTMKDNPPPSPPSRPSYATP